MELVKIKNNDIFTDSMVIANGTDNQHHTVTRLVRNYESKFNTLGKLGFKIQPSSSGQKIKIYELNEPQATFLMTLLRNSDIVVDFKLKLTKEFYHMRTALMERQTTEWLQTRQNGKLIRRKETDALARLKVYAEEQREGKPYPNIYRNYTKLVNNAVGIKTGERNTATFKQLQMISLLEDMVQNTVKEEMKKGVFFKEIYKKCKTKVNTFISLMYLDTDVKKISTAS